jgi:hypothetical protein
MITYFLFANHMKIHHASDSTHVIMICLPAPHTAVNKYADIFSILQKLASSLLKTQWKFLQLEAVKLFRHIKHER